jgi:CoA-transferase family III
MDQAAEMLRLRSDGRTAVDGLALLGERAACADLARQGATSCGGGTRLVQCADGWVAVSLARPDDRAALPAWLHRDVPADDPWPAVSEVALETPVAWLDERAALLGLPFAALGSVDAVASTAFGLPLRAALAREGAAGTSVARARVIDLSTLWAGPLCGQLLASAGADVIKVESSARPDSARQGPATFFDLLNGTKRSVALDLRSTRGQAELRQLMGSAQVVIESARPRALEQMGIVASEMLTQGQGPAVWISITSHGRGPGRCDRVGFGDVAAVAGGLVAGDACGPCFLADAVADPLSGLVAAAAAAEALASGGRWLVDVPMAPMAASVSGPLLDVSSQSALPPRARQFVRRAPPLGSDTAAVMGELTR